MKLSQITKEMKEMNGAVAFGSECNAWQDFVEDCHRQYGMGPWSDLAEDTEVSQQVSRRTHDTMMINKVEIKIYPASIQSDMKEWFNPSLILIAEVKLGECNEYGCNDKILTIKDQEGNEIYKNTGDLEKDINLLLKLYENLGWKDYEAFSLFETNNAYGFLSKAREELEK